MRNRTPNDFEPVEDKSLVAELRRNWFLIALVFCLAIGGFFAFRPDPPPPPPELVSSNWVPVAQPVQIRNFTLTTGSGAVNNVSDFYGRPKIIMGYTLECEPCIQSLKTLDKVAPVLRGRVDILPIAISTQATSLTELIEREFEEAKIENLRPYTINQDVGEGIFNRNALPHSYITDPNNMVAIQHTGAGNWEDNQLFALIEQLEQVEQ